MLGPGRCFADGGDSLGGWDGKRFRWCSGQPGIQTCLVGPLLSIVPLSTGGLAHDVGTLYVHFRPHLFPVHISFSFRG